MATKDASIDEIRSRLAGMLDWADQHGLVDVGIHLNDALLAIDRETAFKMVS